MKLHLTSRDAAGAPLKTTHLALAFSAGKISGWELAEVSVDGRVVGNTPQIKIRVTPGRHHLLLAREGFQTHSAWVVVPAGGNVRLTDITLTVVTR